VRGLLVHENMSCKISVTPPSHGLRKSANV
jgi:hypothetical protein